MNQEADALELWHSIQDLSPEQAQSVVADKLMALWLPSLRRVAEQAARVIWRQTDIPHPLRQDEQVAVVRRNLQRPLKIQWD
jgi:hypothetical protein